MVAPTVADLVVARIAHHTDHLFGVGGANIEDIYDAVHRGTAPVTGIVAKHEFGAATMADGYARATNRLGVVAATSGGGALNTLAALGESFDSRVPVLALIGQPPLALEGKGAFQDTSGAPGRMDAELIFGAVSRYCAKVRRAQDIHEELDRAITAALAGGPAVLLLPKDIQQAAVAAPPEPRRPAREPNPSQSDSLDRALALIATAPDHGTALIIAGPEIAAADARAELAALAVALDARVAVTPDAKDVFPNAHPRFAGVTGVMGHPNVPELVARAELVILAGAAMSHTASAGLAGLAACPRVVHLGIDEPFVPVHARVPGDLATLLRETAFRTARSGGRTTGHLAVELPALTPPRATGPGVRYREAVAALAARLEPGTGIVADAGNTGAAVVHHLPIPEGGRFLIALGMGGMGYSFGAGIGMALGRNRRTVVIAGDGSYFMHGHEVHTAVEYQAPVTFIVFNNNAHAMCVTREQLYYTGDYTFNRFRPADIGAGVAALLPGLPAWSARTLGEFTSALDKANAEAGPAFIELHCDPDEVPPFLPFLKEFTA
ncbi:thiamine pyrophosphate-binding protein [Nocardia sp. 2]|uniref:acetolactate synthase n=1 Tax=Nocardia acididurans TaxID=2802282 RepID=A0ABS1MC18_9NOCA|nr:thiamine pyrophosphate-binding protein [Nocardia acididurans]